MQERKMTRFRFLAAAVILSAAIATPAFAQPVIQEPGNFAFFYPNGDLGIGSKWPSEAMTSPAARNSDSLARLRGAAMSHAIPAKRSHPIKAY
jgi:hypothetical protein